MSKVKEIYKEIQDIVGIDYITDKDNFTAALYFYSKDRFISYTYLYINSFSILFYVRLILLCFD